MGILDVLPYLTVHLTVAGAFTYASNNLRAKQTNDGTVIRYSFNGKILITIAFVVYIIFSIGREIAYDIGGIDAFFYRNAFLDSLEVPYIDFLKTTHGEFGYLTAIWIIGRIFGDFKAVILFFHSISFFCIAYALKYVSSNRRLIGFFYTLLLTANLFTMFCTLRQDTVVALGSVVFVLFEKKEYKRAFFCIVIGISIHLSMSILLVPFLLCVLRDRVGLKASKFIPIIILLLIAEMLMLPIVMNYVSYTEYGVYTNEHGVAIGTYVIIVVVIIMFMFLKKGNDDLFLDKDTLILLTALMCIPIQAKFSIAYRFVLIYIPFMYRLLVKGCSFNRLAGRMSVKGIMINVVAYGYLVYRLITVYTVDFNAAGLFPYIWCGF